MFPASGCGRSLETSVATASAVGHGSIVYSAPVSTSCVAAGVRAAVVPTIATAPAVRHNAPTTASAQTMPPNLVISPSSIPSFRPIFLPSCRPNIGEAGYLARRPFARTRTAAPMANAAMAAWIPSTVSGVRFKVSGRLHRSAIASSPGSWTITRPFG